MSAETTSADVDRAARTLQQIAAIPSLHGGIVAFDIVGLAGGWWYEVETWASWYPIDMLPVPVPGGADFEECRQVILRTAAGRRPELLRQALQLTEPRHREAREHMVSLARRLSLSGRES